MIIIDCLDFDYYQALHDYINALPLFELLALVPHSKGKLTLDSQTSQHQLMAERFLIDIFQ